MKNRALPVVVGVLATLCVLQVDARIRERSSGDLSGAWHLFVDDSIVSEKHGVTRSYYSFQKHARNPVLKPERPWEGKSPYVYGTILPGADGTGYRMWYHAWTGKEYRNLYATSRDGITWDRPALGLHEFEGSRENNLLFRRTKEDHMPQVIDRPWQKDPARRYLFLNYDYGRTPPSNIVSGYWLAYSSDGINWVDAPRNPVLPDVGDVGNVTWDGLQKKYILYTKVFAPVNGYRRRAVGYSSTSDPERWKPAELIMVPDEFDDRWVVEDKQHTDFYGLSGFAYGSGYIGFLWIFRITDGANDGPIWAELVSSRDGINWVRREGARDPILDIGQPGSWDGGMVVTPNHPLVEGDIIKLFYGGFSGGHGAKQQSAGIGLATMRKDGFASLGAAEAGGTILTRPLERVSGKLRVNATIADGGELRAELLDASGRIVPGYALADCKPVSGDSVDRAVEWGGKGTLPRGLGKMRIRFQITRGEIYSFHVGDEATFVSEPSESVNLAENLVLHGNATFSAPTLTLRRAGDAAEVRDSGRLGTRFTLAARVQSTGKLRARLFSNYRGTGDPASGELIFDFEPRTGILRFIVNGQRVQSRPRYAADVKVHHYAATYDNGNVRLYFDGEPVASGTVRQGTAHLYHSPTIIEHFSEPGTLSDVGVILAGNLQIGEDVGTRFLNAKEETTNPRTEQLVGSISDILVVRTAMTPSAIRSLAQ